MESLFAGGGDIRQRCRMIDWRATPLGAVGAWPASLRAVVGVCLDAASIPMAVWAGPEFTLIYNDGYADGCGTPIPAAALGRPAREMWPHAWAQLDPLLQRVVDQGECVQCDGGVLARHDGDAGTFVSHCFTPVRGDGGEVVAALDVALPAETRLRQLADAMPQVVWMARPDGHIDYINQRITELAGVRRLDDGTWTWGDVLVDEDRAATIEAWANAVEAGTPYEIAHRLRRTDGTVHWHLSRAVPVRGHEGRIVRWFGTATDIESQKRAEEAAREADRHKTDFLAWLSHELRNPIGIIHTSLALIERAGLDSEPARRALPVIQRQVGQVDRLLEDLLDLARISKGKMRLRRESLDLNEIVRTAGEDHRQLFVDERIAFDVTVAGEPLRARVDRARIAQAIGNLLQNAAKFTPAEGRVALSLAAGDSRTALIAVHDSGSGLAPEMCDKIFEPLVQDARTIHRSRGGLGLGLALVRQLAELHGGTAAASAAPDGGAIFTIRLPLE